MNILRRLLRIFKRKTTSSEQRIMILEAEVVVLRNEINNIVHNFDHKIHSLERLVLIRNAGIRGGMGVYGKTVFDP